VIRRVATVLLLACPAACTPPDYPGESRGFYHVVGVLRGNSCGAAVPALNPLVFDVEVRGDGGQGFWRRASIAPVSGVLRDDNTFEFIVPSRVGVTAPRPEIGDPGCVLDQHERMTGALKGNHTSSSTDGAITDSGVDDAGVDAATGESATIDHAPKLEGSSVIALSPSAGSSCAGVLVAQGGVFSALPCSVDYALDGTLTNRSF
jgi:hypothetical protein